MIASCTESERHLFTEASTPRFGSFLNSQLILSRKILREGNAADFHYLELNKSEKEWKRNTQKKKMKGFKED